MTKARIHDTAVENITTVVDDLVIVNSKTGQPIVTGVSFELARSEILGIVGESGSGKSTLGRALLGFAKEGLAVSEGSVRVDNVDVLRLNSRDLRSVRGRLVSYVPQDPAMSLNPARRIGTLLREALTIHSNVLARGETVDDRLAKLFEQVKLPWTPKFLNSFPHQMSGGQQQRVAIVMAFACHPRLVVLDEPTTGLDVTTQSHILTTVRELATAHQTSAVYISHDLPVVAQIADTCAVVYAGEIVEYGPIEAVFRAPRHQYTAGLLRAIPSPRYATRLIGIEGHPPSPGRRPAGCRFAARCRAADDECRTTPPDLEEQSPNHRVRCYHPTPAGSKEALQLVAEPTTTDRRFVVRDLTASYGGRPTLHRVDIDVAAGECVGIVGESGSGKTTLARCLVGLHTSCSAEISLYEQPVPCDVKQRTRDDRRLIQYVFQNPFSSLNPRMSVAANIAEPLRIFTKLSASQRRTKAIEALEQVALGANFADRMPERLSGGERQRVAVARALVVQPQILICDEITSALDVSVQALLIEQLRELQRQTGMAMLFITHNLAVVRSIAQRVVVLQSGHIVESGTVADVMDRPQHAYTRQLLSDLPA